MSTLIWKPRICFWGGAIALLALLSAAAPANAAWLWDGGGADDLLTTAENWNPDGIFDTSNTTSNTDSSIQFMANPDGAFPLVPDGSTTVFNNVTFMSGADPFTIKMAGTTGTFMLGPNSSSTLRTLENQSSNQQTFDVLVDGARVDIKATGADFVFNQAYSQASSASSRYTRILGDNDVWFNGGITTRGKDTTSADTAGQIKLQGTGTTYIPAASVSTHSEALNGYWNGVFNIYSGALRISHDKALGAGTADGDTSGRTIIQGSSNTGRLELTGGITVSERFLLGARSGSTNYTPHIVNVSGNNTLTGLIEASSGGTNITIQSDAGLLTLNGDATVLSTATSSRILWLRGAGNGVFNGIIKTDNANPSYSYRLYKEDAGTWTLTNANTITRDTAIFNGTLALSGAGAIATSSQIDVKAGATFDVSGVTDGVNPVVWTLAPSGAQTLIGSGTVKGNVQDAWGAKISGGTLGTAGTLTFTNNLSLVDGGTLQFDLGPDLTIGGGLNDLLTVGGNLSLAGFTTLSLNNLDSVQGFAAGTYRLIDYTGTLTGNASNLMISTLGQTRQNFSVSTATPKQVNLVVTGAPLSLTWKGDGTYNAWDVTTTANWNNNTEKFFPLDSVTFDDTGSNNPSVSLSSDVAPGSITVNNSTKNYTFAGYGAILGNTGLTKNGSGKLTIENYGLNAFKGAIAVNEGTLEVGSAASGGYVGNLGTGPISLAAGTTLTFSRSDTVTLANVISGTGTLEQNGQYGILDITGSNVAFAGPVTVSQGTLKLTSNNDLGTVDNLPNITNNGIVQLDSAAASWTPNRVIVGAGSVEKNGANTVTLNYDNAYSGGTTVNGGTLRVGGTAGTVGTGPVAIALGATLRLSRHGDYTVANAISGDGAVLIDQVDGVVTLAGDNTYNGNTTFTAGTVIPGSATAFGTTTGYTYIEGGDSTAKIVLTGGLTIDEPIRLSLRSSSTNYSPHFVNQSGSNTIAGPIETQVNGSRATFLSDGTAPGDLLTLSNTITNATTGTDVVAVRGAGNGVISGAISTGVGDWRLYKYDTGTWTVTSSANTFTGFTYIYDGTLALKDYGTLASSMAVVLRSPTAKFDVAQTYNQTFAIGAAQGLIGAGTVIGNVATTAGSQLSPSGPVFLTQTFSNTTSRLNYLSGLMTIQGTSATTGLDLSGGESLVFKLSSNTASADNDKIQINGRLNLLNYYGSTKVLIVPNTALSSASSEYTLINADSQSGVFDFVIDPNHNTRYSLSLNNSTPGVVKLKVEGTNANLVWAGTTSAVWDLKTTANWTGADGLFYQADAVSFTDASSVLDVTIGDALNPHLYPASVTVDSSKNYTFNGTGSIANSATLTKSGTGTLTINNDNGYFGVTTITGGTLVAGSGGALGSNLGGTVINGGTLDSNGQDFNDEPINVQGMGVANNGALVNNSTTKNYFRYVTLDGPAAIGGSGNWDITGPVVADSGVLPGYLHGGGHALTKVGASEIDLLDLGDTGLGDINIASGRLYFQGNTTMGDNTKAVTLSNGAWLGLWNPTVTHSKTIVVDTSGGQIDNWEGPGAMSSPIALLGDAKVSTGNGSTLTLSGAIVGAGGLTKINSNTAGGTLILVGDNSYTGDTVISQGTLELAEFGQISPLSAITNDAVFLVNAGTHTVGTIAGSGTLNVLGDSTVTAASISQGTLTIGGPVVVSAAAVPEPGTWSLLLVGLIAAICWRQVRKR